MISLIFILGTQVLSVRKTNRILHGTPIHGSTFVFPHEKDAWGNYSSVFTQSEIPSTWTCPSALYGSNDGCDCMCGAWDPDCDAADSSSAQKVFNCGIDHASVTCAMSLNVPSTPICLYDKVASSAALAAGFSPLPPTAEKHSTATLVAASVGSAIGALVAVAVITFFIRRRRELRVQRSMQQVDALQMSSETQSLNVTNAQV
jgi:hypothetical protein